MIRRPPRSTLDRSSAASDVYKRQEQTLIDILIMLSSHQYNLASNKLDPYAILHFVNTLAGNNSKINENVKIINRVNDVREIISITDIGLLSSRFSEYICRIAMEFMSFKIPIVAPNVNVIPEVVDSNENGFIYQLNDSKQAADFIVTLANDPNLMTIMGNNSFNRMNQFYDISVFDKQIKSILESIK